MDYNKIQEGVIKLIKKSQTELPVDVIESLEKALSVESGIAKLQIANILENIRLAKATGRPLCQDTGVQTFFIEAGVDFPKIGHLKKLIIGAVKKATEIVPLRPNAVDPFNSKNQAGNIGNFIPAITWDFISGTDVNITAIPKGGGSENMSKLVMLKPASGINGIKKFVIDEIKKAGGNPCPPTVIGLGIGGGADLAMKLGKLALLRPVGLRHEDKNIADIEEELIQRINKTGIGPMGLGGKTTVLDVHIEHAPRHPASLPVGMVVQCWADRRAKMVIHQDGRWEVL
ncbi:MAG: fumarate hydratase [Candidatus Thermoplasmatota archaeon]|nr:fumarate hydratase [Candidatus Thermoplasmatota archaeon]